MSNHICIIHPYTLQKSIKDFRAQKSGLATGVKSQKERKKKRKNGIKKKKSQKE